MPVVRVVLDREEASFGVRHGAEVIPDVLGKLFGGPQRCLLLGLGGRRARLHRTARIAVGGRDCSAAAAGGGAGAVSGQGAEGPLAAGGTVTGADDVDVFGCHEARVGLVGEGRFACGAGGGFMLVADRFGPQSVFFLVQAVVRRV
ncbi:hypothetical protein PspLS_02682 [Pyricularia sp. CBS 133598]|nr:hypothetical protein PspLS_02682 [Pyricularia sp. CBS 133598]